MKTFNIIIAGYGGQGVLSLAGIIASAGLKQGYAVKESELHGLAQRGGSLECHIRLGSLIHSPVVPKGRADLIVALELNEALRACYWANRNTIVIANQKIFRSPATQKELTAKIKQLTGKLYLVDADNAVREITGDIIAVNTFMLGYAIKKGNLPVTKKAGWSAVKCRIKERFLAGNRKVFFSALK